MKRLLKSGIFHGTLLIIAGFYLAWTEINSAIPTPWGFADLSAICGSAGIILIFLNAKTSSSGQTAASRIAGMIKRGEQ